MKNYFACPCNAYFPSFFNGQKINFKKRTHTKVKFFSPFFIVQSRLKTKWTVIAEFFPLTKTWGDRQQHKRRKMDTKEVPSDGIT